nr:hypothetical protein [Tanacetum cinerariifolium]
MYSKIISKQSGPNIRCKAHIYKYRSTTHRMPWLQTYSKYDHVTGKKEANKEFNETFITLDDRIKRKGDDKDEDKGSTSVLPVSDEVLLVNSATPNVNIISLDVPYAEEVMETNLSLSEDDETVTIKAVK